MRGITRESKKQLRRNSLLKRKIEPLLMMSLMMKMIHHAVCVSGYGEVTKGRKVKNGPSVTFATNTVVLNASQEELTFLVTSTATTAVFEGNLA